MKGLDYTLLTLVIIGAINWGLIGFFQFDLVAFIAQTGLYLLTLYPFGIEWTLHDQCIWTNSLK